MAWETGFTLDLYKPFMETSKQQHVRFRCNAMMLALAQAIDSDEVVIDEARQSIGAITSGELEWFRDLIQLDIMCQKIKGGEIDLQPSQSANPGDVALHRTVKNWNLRVVLGSDKGMISMIKLSKPDMRCGFQHGQIGVTCLLPLRARDNVRSPRQTADITALSEKTGLSHEASSRSLC